MDQSFDRIEQLLEELRSRIDTEVDEDLGHLPYRVIHFPGNPRASALEQEEAQYKALVEENNRLKARLSQLESGNDANETMRIDEAVNNHHQIQLLTQRVTAFRERGKRIIDELKKTAWSFRDACFLLTGYRVDKLKDDVYRLSVHQGGHDDESLYFNRGDGSLKLIENNYSIKLAKLTSSQLKGDVTKSYPAFLAAIILHSLDPSTNSTQMMNQTQAMDISMSTTILPHPSHLRRI